MRKLLMILVICVFITGCGSNKTREVKTLDDFKNIAIENNFSVDDNDFAYSHADYIEASMVAKLNDVEIEMVVYTNADYASQVQEQQIDGFATLKHTGAFIEKEKGANYYDYVLISNNRYMVTTRIDNTLIFTKAMIADKDIVSKIIDGLGY